MKLQPPRTPSSLSDSVHHQLNMYALAASAAGVGVLALAQPLEAKIVYTKTHQSISLNSRYKLDLNHDGITDFVLSNFYGSGESSWGGFLAIAVPRGNAVMTSFAGSSFASALAAGIKIRANSKFNARSFVLMADSWAGVLVSGRLGPWLNVKNRYLGLRFAIDGKTHYGWARLNASCGDLRCQGLLTGYAYETIPNKPIITGRTKGPDVITVEPASLGHLAAGSWAIPAWRSGK